MSLIVPYSLRVLRFWVPPTWLLAPVSVEGLLGPLTLRICRLWAVLAGLAPSSGRPPQLPSQLSSVGRTTLVRALGVGRSLVGRHFRSHHLSFGLAGSGFPSYERDSCLGEPTAPRSGTFSPLLSFGQSFFRPLRPVGFVQGA